MPGSSHLQISHSVMLLQWAIQDDNGISIDYWNEDQSHTDEAHLMPRLQAASGTEAHSKALYWSSPHLTEHMLCSPQVHIMYQHLDLPQTVFYGSVLIATEARPASIQHMQLYSLTSHSATAGIASTFPYMQHGCTGCIVIQCSLYTICTQIVRHVLLVPPP
jgi:hypothetical protein